MKVINNFYGEYRFLSNFYNAKVEYMGLTYENNEAAFQSLKTLNMDERKRFQNLPPNKAKALGRRVKLRSDWEEVKDFIMYDICKAKFTQNKELSLRLLETGDAYLEEGNTWGDKYWGTVNGNGRNRLGIILMYVRDYLKDKNEVNI